MSAVAALAAWLLVGGAASGGNQEPTLKVSVASEHYTIEADSLEDVVAQIQGRQARDDDDGTSIARTRAYQPPEGADCAAVERAILRERIKAQMRHENVDAAYDRRTRHGITQAPEHRPQKE